MFSRLDKFDEPIFEGAHIQGELIFGMRIGFNIWGAYIRGTY